MTTKYVVFYDEGGMMSFDTAKAEKAKDAIAQICGTKSGKTKAGIKVFGAFDIDKLLSKGDKVRYSPYEGCDEDEKTIETVTSDERPYPNMGVNGVTLEGKSGIVDAANCELVYRKISL